MYYVNTMFEGRRRLAGLGDTSSTQVQIDTIDVLNFGDSLRNAQSRLNAIVAQMRQDPDLARAIGPSVTAQQAALGDITAKYVGVYTAIFGQPPAGLGNPIFIAAGVALLFAALVGWLYAWTKKQDALEQQAQAQILAEQNRGSIISIAQQKQADAQAKAAAGDAAGAADDQAAAQALLLQAGTPGAPAPAPQSFAEWVKGNALTIGLVAGAIVIVPRLVNR